MGSVFRSDARRGREYEGYFSLESSFQEIEAPEKNANRWGKKAEKKLHFLSGPLVIFRGTKSFLMVLMVIPRGE